MKDREEKYHDITPFFGQEFDEAFFRFLSQTDKIAKFADSFVSEGEDGKKILLGYIDQVKDRIHSYTDFQNELTMRVFIPAVISNTATGYDVSGIENIEDDKAYLYISTHRDIVLDCTLIDYSLFRHNKPMCQMAFGDNLIQNPFIGDLLRLNGGIIVRRNLPMKEKYIETVRLSDYMAETVIGDGYSVWLAQRSGRSKDGIDETHPAIIKMLYLAPRRNKMKFPELISKLRIVPTAVSYQYNPNDINMGREEVKTIHDGAYEKKKYEDTISMIKGIRGFKGGIHVSFGKPLEGHYETPEEVAKAIDREIHRIYKLWDTNYFAYDYLERTVRFKEHYKDFDTEKFLSRIAHLHDDVKAFVLNSYANPVREFLKIDEGN